MVLFGWVKSVITKILLVECSVELVCGYYFLVVHAKGDVLACLELA